MPERGEILFWAELSDGEVHRGVLELSALSRRLADELQASASALLLTGAGGQDQARHLISHGADKVYVIEDSQFGQYHPEAYSLAIEQVCRKVNPEILLFSHTLHGVDLAPRLSWKLKAGLATDSVEFRTDPGSKKVFAIRPVYGSKGMAVMVSDSKPLIATLRSKAVSPAVKDETRNGEIIPVEVKVDPGAMKIRAMGKVREEAEGPKLEDAKVIVSGGRGVGHPENFTLLEELAHHLGGVVGGSRVAVDKGWLPSSRQVGLTGTMVSPHLYLAVGISGATQHMAGCATSQYIVAINTDPDAPIFRRAHFGVVADFRQVLPKMIEMLKSG